jgi:hypothetical protein
MTARIETGAVGEDRERHGLVYHPDQLEEHGSAVLLAKDIADQLEKHYPGWLWGIGVDSKGGIVTIRSLRLSAEWGYVLKLDWVQHDPVDRRRRVLKAGGEILERYGVKARQFNREQFARIRRDLAGKLGKVQRRARDEALTAAVRGGQVSVRWGDAKRADGSRYRRILIAGAGPKDPDVLAR